ANPHRAITHFAQHQVLLIGLIAAFCTGLCSVTVYSTDEYGMLSRWWAMFDAFVLITMYSWLGYLKRSLSAGRQG
ncbi:MAG: hypothetical protein OIF55_14600, partial [Amphritea sp.]|nr:hypothetical protein [Amphritea sp.]